MCIRDSYLAPNIQTKIKEKWRIYARTFHWGGMYGRIVTNPPYGERIMERREAEELYRAFGKAWTKFPETWKLYLLSSHTEFERTFGKTADRKRKLYNGMLKCDLFLYGVK